MLGSSSRSLKGLEGRSRQRENQASRRSLKELARQALVMELEMNREPQGRPVAMSEPQPRPAKSSVGDNQSPRDKAMMQTWAMLRVTGGDPESRWKRRETKRVRINVFDGEEWVETEEEWVRIHRRPRRELFSPHNSHRGPKLSDISKRHESTVCSTDVGEWDR